MSINTLEEQNTHVILVDPQDNCIGIMDKLSAHQEGKLHRAYSILVFRKNRDLIELLLQQRAHSKYHGGGLWTNTCCSHPQPDKDLLEDATKRVLVEMGIKVTLFEVGVFQYFAELNNNMFEHEIDHVLIGYWVEQSVHPNPLEVDNYCWISIDKLQEKLAECPQVFTPWLSQVLDIALESKQFIHSFGQLKRLS
ncbi:isopentenyl-diphosphate Delta-isomerase [Legionella sp. PATHC035]|uniref:isopentenyl-diphosphate Delta-isomerase n=1 Tax=Legionella sp. PATHC035 TaxID=2992040 RepID=UPI002243118F|nr:isopentenyl-diphosphate Delta-isomerase [Legionella sp. PATHC035]MCW8409804.1 isopentenyl-diphosphate Delta-isomerase [Legionella sp. PATHC035]